MRKRERPSAAAGRGEISLNGVWAFRSAADAEWTSIRVPGAYAGVRQSWGGAQWDCFDYPRVWEGKAAVYRRSFLVPDEMQGLDLRFGGYACAHHSEFLLNGEKIGEWHDGYTPFEFPLNAALIVGENIIEVRVSDRPNDLFDDYGTHRRGFWQDTFLKARPWVAVGNDPFVKTSVARGEIVCEIPVENGLGTEAVFAIECVVTGPDGSVAKRFGSAQSHRLAAGARALFSLSAPWSNPRLWFPHDPHLYHVHVRLLDAQGGVLDHLRLRFGFREVTWHGPHLYLNGRELFLRGHGGHYFGDIQGTRAYMETWLGNLRALGVNFMRLHDSPKHRELYEVADELGMLLEAEAVCHFQVPADPVIWQGHLERLIKAQRNHPSVIIWSVSNELRWRGGGEKPEMIAHAKRFDLTRPVFASDFSLESRHGDLCGHHYAPVTVFEDWQRYGPDKPMLWDELGSVWAHDRPLDNGTSGYEAQAQDYATGLWHDGHDQILRDILLHHEGKLFNGELHRVSGFIPWDLSYNFFRWQPTNNNQLLELRHDDLGGPGIKHKHVRPVASPVNPWDPTLPALEPNPGFALFAPFMRPVRFFDDRDERTFFADAEWEASARIIYDDLRLADELVCRVETLAGEALSEKGQPLELAPGRIMENVVCRFSFPAVAHATPVRLVREFRYRGAPGYRDERLGKIFPRVRHPAARIGALGDTETVALERAGVAVARCESGIPDCDLLLAEPGALARADVRAWIERGGRALCCLAGAAQGLSPQNRIMDDFTTANGGLSPDRGLRSANGCVWYGWTQTGEIRLNQPETMSPTYGLAGQLEFNRVTEPGAYVFALFDQPLAHFEEGLLRLRYQTPLRDIEQLARGAARLFNRQVGLLVRDAQGCWFVSDEACAFALGRGGAPAFSPASLEWREVTSLRAGRPYGALETRVGGVPDLSIVTGAGLYQHRVPEEGLPFWLASIEWRGRAAPTALIPFNGPRHRLLEGVDQQDLSFWRGGSSRGILELPERCNYRVVLAGNKDGMGAALYERMIGAGLAVVTALKLDDLDREPAAHGLLGNIIAYLAAYQAEPGGRCAVQVAPELEACLDQVGLVRQDAIAGANVLIIDGPHAAEALVTGVSAQVKAGATLLVCGVEEPHLEAVGRLTGCDLVLTEPYLGERRHCVKAAVSWTKRDTPPIPAEYYEGVMIPQPFEPNYDPVIAGWVNRDLAWDGRDMFQQGIELRGMDPVRAHADYSILVSNWRIDWRKPKWGGEYTHAPRDQQRADWFVNRDPVMLKVRHGKGAVVFCQLDWLAPGEKPRRVLTQLLTNLGCALGGPNRFAAETATFDPGARADQLARFAAHYRRVAATRRRHYGIPAHRRDEGDPADVPRRAPTLMIGDFLTARTLPYVAHSLWDTHEVSGPAKSLGTTREALEAVRRQATDGYSVVLFGLGLEDLKLGPDGCPAVGLDEFKANLEQVLAHLRTTGAKLYWTNIPPLPTGDPAYRVGAETAYNAAAQELMDVHGVYTVDLHTFVQANMPEVPKGDNLDLTPQQWASIAAPVAQAIQFFGAQQ